MVTGCNSGFTHPRTSGSGRVKPPSYFNAGINRIPRSAFCQVLLNKGAIEIVQGEGTEAILIPFPMDFVNPLRPNNDVSQTSHCNIKGLSVSEVKRIEIMITQVKFY